MVDISRRELIASAASFSAAALVARTVNAAQEPKSTQCPSPCYPVMPEETAVRVEPRDLSYRPGEPQRYGAVVDGAADNARAIQSAIAVMAKGGGGVVQLPRGRLRCAADVALDARVVLKGHQFGSHLEFTDAGLVLDGSRHTGPKAGLDYSGIHDVRVSRRGSAGFAVRLVGDGGTKERKNRDIVRFDIRRLQILGSSGGGLEIRGAYIGAFDNLIIQNCSETGLLMDQQKGEGRTGVNAVSFFGGEIQNCAKAADLTRLRAVGFYGFVFEGNKEGVDLHRGAAISFDTCYFEANGAYDLRIGQDAGQVFGSVSIRTCLFSGKQDYAVRLVRGHGISIDTCNFSTYAKAGIRNEPINQAAVIGQHRNCTLSGDTPRVADGENNYFRQDPPQDGRK